MGRNDAASSMANIDDFIKQATVKAADGSTPLSEPGSQGGETSHPVKNVDDRLEKAKEGERSKENSKDVKEEQGPPSVESKSAASIFDVAAKFKKKAEGDSVNPPGTAEDDQLQIGTKKAPTGEDAKNETSSAKGGKEDPGSTHPARTDNDSLDGHKYASDDSLEKLAQVTREIGNDLCANLAWVSNQQGATSTAQKIASQANVTPTPPKNEKAANDQTVVDAKLALQAGYEMAGLLTGDMDKRAVDAAIQEQLYEVVKTASEDADNYISFVYERMKQAEGPPMPGGEPPMPGGGGEPPMPGMEGGGGEDPSAMMAALGGGADPSGGAGGAGGDISPEQALQILEALGVSPEEIEQMLAQGGGGGGEMPPPGGAAPPSPGGGAAPGGGGMEVAASVNPQLSKEATAYLKELIDRSKKPRK